MTNRPDELQHAIDAALRRRFPVPARPAAFLDRLLADAAPATRRGGPTRTALLAAAAAVVLLALWIGAARERPAPVTTAGLTTPPAHAPDLAALYYEITTARDDPWTCPSPEELAAGLAATYQCCDDLIVQPGAADVLEGPFDSTLWPGGTILTGDADGRTAVLIAERDTQHRCCVLPTLSEGSELEVFTWKVGDLVLTEVTPLSEPRLLDYFGSAP